MIEQDQKIITGSREFRRSANVVEKRRERYKNRVYSPAEKVGSVDEILDNTESIHLLEQEIKKYQIVQRYDSTERFFYRTIKISGITDDEIKEGITKLANGEINHFDLRLELLRKAKALALSGPHVLLQSYAKSYNQLHEQVLRMAKLPAYSDRDSEDTDEIRQMVATGAGTVDEVLAEAMRVRGENISLLMLQLEWLKEVKKKEKLDRKKGISKDQIEGPLKTEVPEDQEIIQIDETFERVIELSGRKLFISKKPFSTNPNHLIEVPTYSRSVAESIITEITRQQASIPAHSILNTAEFYSRLDVIKRALLARNKYARVEVRDWHKVPRGRDRIHFYLENEESKMLILWIEGRDKVYESI